MNVTKKKKTSGNWGLWKIGRLLLHCMAWVRGRGYLSVWPVADMGEHSRNPFQNSYYFYLVTLVVQKLYTTSLITYIYHCHIIASNKPKATNTYNRANKQKNNSKWQQYVQIIWIYWQQQL